MVATKTLLQAAGDLFKDAVEAVSVTPPNFTPTTGSDLIDNGLAVRWYRHNGHRSSTAGSRRWQCKRSKKPSQRTNILKEHYNGNISR